MIKSENGMLAVYTYSHFCVDAVCSFILWNRMQENEISVVLLLLLYHALAFAFQPIIGYVCDKHKSLKVGIMGTGFVSAALLISTVLPIVSVLIAGLGNAFFHLEGGYVSLHREKRNIGPGGVFVSGGALGIGLGSVCGRFLTHVGYINILFLLIAISSFILTLLTNVDMKLRKKSGAFGIVRKDISTEMALGLICISVFVRGYAGLIYPVYGLEGKNKIIILAVTMFLAKFVGGMMADRFGIRRIAVISQAVAAICLIASRSTIIGCIGIFLLNIPMAVTLAALSDCLPENTGLAFGMAPLCLFAGMVFTYGYAPKGHDSNIICMALLLITAVLFMIFINKNEIKEHNDGK